MQRVGRKVGFVLIAVAAVGLVVLAQWPRFVSIATGGVAGVYYPLGGVLARLINEKMPGVTATAETTGGSVANARLLENGSVEIAFIQNDIAHWAHYGKEMFDKAVPQILGLASLYPETIQIVTLADSGITSIADLRGKRVAVGAAGSGTEANARQILAAAGITYADISVQYLAFAPASAALKDGHVDAAFLTAGIPTAAVIDLATTHRIRIVPIGEDILEKLAPDYPFYVRMVIPQGTYTGLDQDVESVAVMAMLVVRADLSADFVYNLAKLLFENLDEMARTHARGKDIALERALQGMSVPLHPGAERFYREAGLL